MTDAALPSAAAAPTGQMQALLAGHVVAQGLYVVASLGIPDLLAQRPRSIDDIADAKGLHAASLHRLLRTLASLGVFDETADGEFSLTPLGATLRADAPNSLRDQAIFETSTSVWLAWGHLGDSLRTGQPSFANINNSPLFSYLSSHPDLGTVFNRFMTAQSQLHNDAIVHCYDFSRINTLVDIGGGRGATLAAVLAHYPSLKGVLFDLPEVVSAPVPQIAELSDRCRVVGGSALSSVPAGADVYMLKRVMMSFSDDDSATILHNCRAAMPADGRVLVIDPMLPDGTEPHYNRLTDLLMLVVPGGRCRSEAEFRSLLGGAGLAVTRVIATGTSNFILEAIAR